jgi:hypothetical protein
VRSLGTLSNPMPLQTATLLTWGFLRELLSSLVAIVPSAMCAPSTCCCYEMDKRAKSGYPLKPNAAATLLTWGFLRELLSSLVAIFPSAICAPSTCCCYEMDRRAKSGYLRKNKMKKVVFRKSGRVG